MTIFAMSSDNICLSLAAYGLFTIKVDLRTNQIVISFKEQVFLF